MQLTRALLSSIVLFVCTFYGVAFARAQGAREACTRSYEKAQELRIDQKLVQARAELVVCAQPVCSETAQKDCSGWLADVDRDMPSVVFDVTGADGRPATDVRVELDGTALAERIEGKPFSLNPGKHTLKITVAAQPPKELEIVASVGQKNQRIGVSFEPKAAGRTESSAKPSPKRGVTIHPLVWVFGALGVGGAGTLIYFGVSALTEESTLSDECNVKRACSQDDVDKVYFYRTGADISLGVTAGGFAAMVITLAVTLSLDAKADKFALTPDGIAFRF